MSKQASLDRVVRRLRRIIMAHMRIEEHPVPLGGGVALSTSEVHCLQAIGENEGANVKDVGDALGVTKSAASQMVGKLAGKGFAVKRPATDNNKEILVFLTPSGWDAFAAHKDFHERHIHSLQDRLGNYSEEQVETVDQVLAEVEAVMHERMRDILR
jgi:DNA-binding MarR family transcriptional regulator